MIALGQVSISRAGLGINLPALMLAALVHVMLMVKFASPFAGFANSEKTGTPLSLPSSSLQVTLLLPATAPQQGLQSQHKQEPQQLRTMAEADSSTAAAKEEMSPAAPRSVVGNSPDEIAGLPRYHPASALSGMPEIEGLFEVPLPPGLDLEGQVELRLWIDATGRLDRIQALSSDVPAPYRQAAIAAFQRMHYRPGQIDGLPVAAFVDIVVEINGSASPAGPALP